MLAFSRWPLQLAEHMKQRVVAFPYPRKVRFVVIEAGRSRRVTLHFQSRVDFHLNTQYV